MQLNQNLTQLFLLLHYQEKMKHLKRTVKFFLILSMTFPSLLLAESLSQEEIQALMNRVELRQMDGRDMAQVPLKLILEIALERTLGLKALSFGVEAARTSVIGARERNHPLLQTSFGYSKSASLSSSSGGNGGSSTNSNTLTSTYSQKLNNGMTYDFTYTERTYQSISLTAKDWSSVESSTSGDPYSQSSLSANLKIPFFQDSGSEINSIPVKLAEVGVDRAVLNSKNSKLGLLQGIATIYWDLVSIYQSIELQKNSVAISEQLLRDNQARQRAGQLSPTEVLSSETQLLRDQQTLYSLKQEALKVEDQVRAALNLPTLPVGLFPSDSPSIHSEDLKDAESLLKKILENDTQIALSKAGLKQKQIEILQFENTLDTNLDLDLSYTLKGYSTNSFGGTSEFGNSNLHGLSATLSWAFPLGDRKTQEGLRQKNLESRQIQIQIEDRKSELEVQLQSILRDFKVLEEDLNTAQAVSLLSEKQLNNEIKRLKLGKSTSYQVSQFQQDLARSRQQEILKRVNFEKNFLELLVLSGELYKYYDLPGN